LVAKVASSLQDRQVWNWYRLDCVQIDAAGFPAFMEEVRNEWLIKGWEQKVKPFILGSMQGPTPINDWICLIESTNILVINAPFQLTNAKIHNHIDSHLHPDTMELVHDNDLHLITNCLKYKRALK